MVKGQFLSQKEILAAGVISGISQATKTSPIFGGFGVQIGQTTTTVSRSHVTPASEIQNTGAQLLVRP